MSGGNPQNQPRSAELREFEIAVQNGDKAGIAAFLERFPAYVDHGMDSVGNTPLMYAVNASDADLVRFLISAGADVEARNKRIDDPRSVLSFALSGDSEEIVLMLLNAGAKYLIKNHFPAANDALPPVIKKFNIAATAKEPYNGLSRKVSSLPRMRIVERKSP